MAQFKSYLNTERVGNVIERIERVGNVIERIFIERNVLHLLQNCQKVNLIFSILFILPHQERQNHLVA